MEGLGDCLEFMHSTWLASSFSTCFPQKPLDRPSPKGSKESAAPGTGMSECRTLTFVQSLTSC